MSDDKGGRPLFTPTREQRQMVQVLHAHGISQSTIAKNIGADGIDPRTLRRAFRAELHGAKEQVKAAMIAGLIKAGLGGNVAAIRYWLLCWGGPEWKPPQGHDNDAPNQAAGNTTIIIKGGLPPVVYTDQPDEDEAPAAAANGKGNGTSH